MAGTPSVATVRAVGGSGLARGQTRQVQQFIVTVLALYGRGEDQPVTVAHLIQLLRCLEVDEAATRSALSRLKKRAVVVSHREGGTAAYRLAPELQEVFREGDERIFDGHRSRPDDRWLLVVFSVPESRRPLRHQLRKVLAKRGFGTVGAGLSIAPAALYEPVRRDLDRAGLLEFVEFFAAEHFPGQHMAERIASWWDLDSIAAQYVEFRRRFEPVASRWTSRGASQDSAAFADYVRVVTHWRRLPYLDPGLPAEYLPEDWPGLAAESLFRLLHERLAGRARAHALSTMGR